jgi:hypothetical protein
VSRRRPDQGAGVEDTRDYPRQTPPPYNPYGHEEQPRERRRDGSGRGWMVAFFTLALLVAAGALVWALVLRDGTGGDVEVVPTTVDFGDQDLGERSPVVSVTVDNESSADLRISSIVIEGQDAQDFQLADTTTCSSERPLAEGSSCTIGVRFRPRAREEREAAVVVRIAGRDSPLRVQLHGTGVGAATVVLDTTRLDLGTVLIGKSRTRPVTVTNAGNAPLAIEDILVDGADAAVFSIGRGTDCSTEERLRAGASCQIAVTFRPTEGGGRTAELVIVHDAEGSPAGVALRGEGRGQAQLALDPTTIDFGQVDVGSTSGVETVTITSGGTAVIVLSRLQLAGPAPSDYAIADSSTCVEGVELEPGEACAVDLMFLPTAAGDREAALEVETRGGLAGRVDLSGSGLGAPDTTTTG